METIKMIVEYYNQYSGIVTSLITFAIWLALHNKRRRENEIIDVKIVISNEEGLELSLPLEILRKDVSRGEILGRLGMIPMKEKGKRFSIRSLFTKEAMRRINDVSTGKESVLKIYCSKEEFEQFDI